jgi:hypothetical protein
VWPNGLAGTGYELATVLNDYFSGDVWWLDTVNGTDGAAPAGKEREIPLKTLAQAVTNAAAGDIIVIEAGSAETLAVSQTLAKAGLTILGLGTGANRPRYTANGAIAMFNITAAGTRIYNLYFPASTAVPTSRISTAAAETEINGCYFECGASDTSAAVIVAASATDCRVFNSTFAVTASRPAIGLSVTGAVTDLVVTGCVFDGGSYGWTDYAFKISAAATRILIDGMTLTNRSDFGITITGTSYKIFGVVTSGSGRVVITA